MKRANVREKSFKENFNNFAFLFKEKREFSFIGFDICTVRVLQLQRSYSMALRQPTVSKSYQQERLLAGSSLQWLTNGLHIACKALNLLHCFTFFYESHI